MRHLFWIAALLMPFGCFNKKALIQKFAPKDDDKFARHFVDLISQSRYEEADPMLDSTVAAQVGANGLSQLHKVLDHGQPVSVELVGANVVFLRPWDASNSNAKAI